MAAMPGEREVSWRVAEVADRDVGVREESESAA